MIALSVGDGILFVPSMSAAARNHGPASAQSSRFFDSCAQTVFHRIVLKPDYRRWTLKARYDQLFAVTAVMWKDYQHSIL